MGTPDIAATVLKRLVETGRQNKQWNVTGVISQPDKPAGRNLQLRPTAVHAMADTLNIPCFQPQKARDPQSLEWIRAQQPDLIVVVAYGQILPQALLDIPRYGCINVHTSILPKYRGAAPIQWAILENQSRTGVTLMRMDAGLDTGDIITATTTPITTQDTAETLYDRLSELGANLLVETLPDYFVGKITLTPQQNAQASYVRKITKEDGHIDWRRPAELLSCHVRGLFPWPGAFTYWNDNERKILLKIRKVIANPAKAHNAQPGTILAASADNLEIACGVGTLNITELQREGKRAMDTKSFLAGNRLASGIRLE